MRFKSRVCIIATVLLMAGLASAVDRTWTPLDPNAVVKGYSDWNWTSGALTNWGAAIPTTADKAKMIGPATIAECRVTSTVNSATFSFGEAAAGSVCRILDGGTLYTTSGPATDSWSAIGYNSPAKIIVEEGGTLQIAGRLGIGWFTWATAGQSELLVNGGYVKVGHVGAANLQLGTDGADAALHPGYINVTNGGLIDVNGGLVFNNSDGSNINLEFGSIVFSSNQKTLLDTRIAAGKVKGFGGQTTPTAVYANGKTTLSAPDPMNRVPAYITVLAGNQTLSWTNMAAVPPAGPDVWVDVYFGPDPNMLSPLNTKVVSQGKNVTSFSPANAPLVTEPTTYYWRVDSYLRGDPALVPGDPNVGLVTPFNVTANTAPLVEINTPRMATWINEPIQLNSTLTDDGNSAVTYLWTSDDPNAVFYPSATVDDPNVSVDWHTGPFTVMVTVDDGFNPPVSSGVIAMDCAENACQATTAVINLDVLHPGDAALDCNLNLEDLAVYARNWLMNYQLIAPVPN